MTENQKASHAVKLTVEFIPERHIRTRANKPIWCFGGRVLLADPRSLNRDPLSPSPFASNLSLTVVRSRSLYLPLLLPHLPSTTWCSTSSPSFALFPTREIHPKHQLELPVPFVNGSNHGINMFHPLSRFRFSVLSTVLPLGYTHLPSRFLTLRKLIPYFARHRRGVNCEPL